MDYSAKRWLVWALSTLTWPLALPARFAYRQFGSRLFFLSGATFLSIFPGAPGQYLRASFYWQTLDHSAYDLAIGFLSWIAHPGAVVGTGAYVGSLSILGNVELGNDVAIASRVIIKARDDETRVRIGGRSWIGESAIVTADVGAGCIVGAGAVVAEPVAAGTIVAGNPLRVIAPSGA